MASIIVPWNAPSTLLIRSLAPALAAGCTVVVKGAQQTASVNDLYAKCVSECPSILPGVVNFVHGELAVSSTLCSHGQVDVVSQGFEEGEDVEAFVGRSVRHTGTEVKALVRDLPKHHRVSVSVVRFFEMKAITSF